MSQLRKILVGSLLLSMSFENARPDPTACSTSQKMRKLTDHELEQIEESDRDVRRRRAGCYQKIREQKSPEASKVTNFWPYCDKVDCDDCSNKKHHAMK